MDHVVIRSKVGADGVLHLALPMGPDEAGREVRVTIEPVATPSSERWREFVLATAGSIDDPSFERPPQGEPERRDELP